MRAAIELVVGLVVLVIVEAVQIVFGFYEVVHERVTHPWPHGW